MRWQGLEGDPRGVWEGVGLGVITLSHVCTPTPWLAAGALATRSSMSSLDVDLVGFWVVGHDDAVGVSPLLKKYTGFGGWSRTSVCGVR